MRKMKSIKQSLKKSRNFRFFAIFFLTFIPIWLLVDFFAIIENSWLMAILVGIGGGIICSLADKLLQKLLK